VADVAAAAGAAQGRVIGIAAATEVIVVMVVIEIRAAIEDIEVIIIDITEIIAVVLSTIHKNGPT
jgi:hypothetical protein